MAAEEIHIRDLRVSTRLGVPDAEREKPQTVSVNVMLEPQTPFRDLDERIERTIDYHAACRRIAAVAAERPRRLAETLASELADTLLQEFPARSVEIRVEKEILFQAGGVGVTVRRP
jgi:dihydroneopterin aldolase